MVKRHFCLATVALLVILMFITESVATPSAQHGIMDLRGVNFSASPPVSLNGEWEFQRGVLSSPSTFNRSGTAPRYTVLPSLWKDTGVDARFHGHGVATYRLIVLVDSKRFQTLTLQSRGQTTANRLWVNGHLVVSDGVVAADSAHAVPKGSFTLTDIWPHSDTLELVLQVSNFEHQAGGAGYPIYLGTHRALQSGFFRMLLPQAAVLGIMLLFFFQYAVAWISTPKNRSYAWFTLLSLCGVVVVSFESSNFRLISLLMPGLDYFLVFKINWLAYACIPALVLLFYGSVFPSKTTRIATPIALAGTGLYLLTILFTPLSVYFGLFGLFYLFSKIMYLIVGVDVAIATFRARNLAWIFAIGIFVYEITAILALFVYLGKSTMPLLINYGMCALMIAQATILSLRHRQTNRANVRLLSDIAETNRELTRLSAVKDEFLANTTHELRTPLHGIVGITESIQAHPAAAASAFVRDNLTHILMSARRLSLLVNDILDISKMRHNDLAVVTGPLNLAAVARAVMPGVAPRAEKKDISVVLDIPADTPPVIADEDRLVQILYNLLGNAVKFTDSGNITIAARPVDDGVEVRVSDTGIGIAAEHLSRIFEPFEQAGTLAGEYRGGTGLGLSITRQLVALHGSVLRVTSTLGSGSVFSFVLPQYSGPLPDAASAVQYRMAAVDMPVVTGVPVSVADVQEVVLVIDDEPVNLQIVANHLTAQGLVVYTAESGEAIGALIEQHAPALILLDVMMPRLNGYEVCREIRRHWSIAELPVVFVSARTRIEDLVMGYEAGGSDYVLKPFLREELLARVDLQLRQRRAVAALLENSRLKAELADMILERERLVHMRQRTVALLQSMKAPFFVVDEAETILFASDTVQELLRLSVDDLIEQPLSLLSLDAALPDPDGSFHPRTVLLPDGSSLSLLLHTVFLELEDERLRICTLKTLESVEPAEAQALVTLIDNNSRQMSELSHNIGRICLGVDSASILLSSPDSAQDTACKIMLETVLLWELGTGQSKAVFAEESGLWRVTRDTNGWGRTQTLDRYLEHARMPKFPRWGTVSASALYVIQRVGAQPIWADRVCALQLLVTKLEQLLRCGA